MLHQHPEYNGLFAKHFSGLELFLDAEIIKNPSPEYIDDFFKQLKNHKRYDEIKDDFIYDKDLDIFIHIHNRFLLSEIDDLSDEEKFFYSFMNKDEIKRAFNIKSASDFLLRFRAEQVETSARLKRVFSKLKSKFGDKWKFANYFESKQYRKYLNRLSHERKVICLDIPHGTIHAKEANGMCMRTPYGNVIVLSYALRHFLFYMNLFHYGEYLGVASEDILAAFVLAIRIMIGTESLDFEIDSRGRLPGSMKKKIDYVTDWQMNFIIGHEYAHHYLGHLKSKSILKSNPRASDLKNDIKYYTYNQQCEFEADLYSISEVSYNEYEKAQMLDGAFLFFSFLEMYNRVEEYFSPKKQYPLTHPDPLDRMWRLHESIKIDGCLTKDDLESIVSYNSKFVESFLVDFLPYNIESIEDVGSVYLPSYRKKILVDRLDM